MKSFARSGVNLSAFLLCLFMFLLFHYLTQVTCQASSPESEYKKIQQEIKAQKEKLEQVKKRESSILSDIEGVNKQMRSIESALRKYRIRLMHTESRISEVERKISDSKASVERHREWIKRKLRTIHKYGRNSDVVLLLLSARDISELIRTSKSLQYVAASEHNRMKTYQNNLNSLHMQEKQLAMLKKELIANRASILAEEASLSEKRKQKEATLASVRQEKTLHTKMLREMEKSSQRLLDIIRQSEKSETFSGGGFASLKGRLPWPVDGKVVIPYGSQKDPIFNTPVFRSGTFIETHADSLAKAVHQGRVVFAEWFKGYGQLVILNHGEGYHSLYGSLSEIFTKVGDIIKENQIIGRVGNSGLVNMPGLYFELRYKGKPLNPIQWLKRR